MKLTVINETSDYVDYKIETSEQEEKELKNICEKHSITIQELMVLALKYTIDKQNNIFQFIKENRTDKCSTGKIGNPLFKYKDIVGFYLNLYENKEEIFCKGEIQIIDAYGNSEQSIEPSYDIMVKNFNNTNKDYLVKHIKESELYTMCFKNN